MDVKPYTADLLFEVGVEEMPSVPLDAAVRQLREAVPAALDGARLRYESVTVLSTPRRLAVLVRALHEQQEDLCETHKGPAAAIAYDADGQPTKALLGFARGKGVDAAAARVENVDGTDYVFVTVEQAGAAARELLPQLLAGLVQDLQWPKAQRWGDGDERFIRPVRWLLALYGSQVVPVRFGHLVAGDTTRGHRFLSDHEIPIAAMREYKNVLKGNRVIVDADVRRETIVTQVRAAAEPYGTAIIPEGVLSEVINLTEFPNALVGTFDEEFLRVPREILEYAMSTHQRYFAIERTDGCLDNHFVVVSNGDPACGDVITRGHERVVRARLADAAFFYDEDLKAGIEHWYERLTDVTFQEKLGSVADKVQRIEALVGVLCDQLLDAEDAATGELRATALAAARLAKADLTSNAVVEFTELQGIMGAYYALAAGESTQVADAIREHYRPRFSGDAIPAGVPGQLVAVADKLDTICGIFAAGKAPKGTSDPFALRRAAIGILQIALQSLPLDLSALVPAAVAALPVECDRDAVAGDVCAFIATRLETILRDSGHSAEVTAAVLATAAALPADAAARARALSAFVAAGDEWEDLSTAYTRAKNLADRTVGDAVDTALLTAPEAEFHTAIGEAAPLIRSYLEQAAYPDLLTRLARLRGPVDAFFEQVMIMDEDAALRRNRLALLNAFIALIEPFADFRKLS
ncbi:MAG: glycine--tRNA ligase subunit beta [Actinomycetes bacterium]|jgi:glycyl-tRNA synthetase beta chain|nr:glycine--tRNA ligase subunit beta [Actinomycetes bacterium]